jgi:hypothetical protein
VHQQCRAVQEVGGAPSNSPAWCVVLNLGLAGEFERKIPDLAFSTLLECLPQRDQALPALDVVV